MTIFQRATRGVVFLAGVLGAGALASPAFGDCKIPAAGVTALRLDNATEKAIDDCAAVLRDAFAGDESKLAEARQRVIAPLIENTPSIAFRLAYEERLAPILKPMVKEQREFVAINALRIAGELAASNSLDLLKDGLGDSRPAVRMMAAGAYERSLAAAAAAQAAALPKAKIDKAIADLAGALASEQDAFVLEAIVSALSRASDLSIADFEDAGYESLRAMIAGVGARARGADQQMLSPLLRAATTIQSVLRGKQTSKGEPIRLDEPMRLLMAGFAGDALGLALRQAPLATAETDRVKIVELGASGELILSQVMTQMGKTPPRLDLKAKLEAGEMPKFKAEVLNVIGKGGLLTKPPFSFAPERFQ